MKPHYRCLEDRVLPALRAVFARKPFMTSLAAGLLPLAFLCSTVPAAAQTEKYLSRDERDEKQGQLASRRYTRRQWRAMLKLLRWREWTKDSH